MNSCYFSICCSRYQSLFKKSRFFFQKVFISNEALSVDPWGYRETNLKTNIIMQKFVRGGTGSLGDVGDDEDVGEFDAELAQ